MQMLAGKSFIILSALFIFSALLSATEPNSVKPGEPNAPSAPKLRPTATGAPKPPEKLFSPSVSQLFYDIAYDIVHRRDLSIAAGVSGSSPATLVNEDLRDQQAIVFLNAASELDASAGFVSADLLAVASRPGPPQNLQLVYDTLIKYVDKNADLMVASNAIRYLLQQLDSRQQKEILLSRLIRDLGDSNLYVKSELLTAFGLFLAEKADDANASRAFAMAYSANRYNRLAFEKLVELVPEQISPVLNLEYLRRKVRENPLDLVAAISFAQYARRVQLYELAAGSYEYCADLFRFLYPGRNVPADIFRDWMTSCYNVPRSRPYCLQLAEQFRRQGRFDLQVEVLAAKAAEKSGDIELAQNLLNNAEKESLELMGKPDSPVNTKTLAWFYCFVRPDPNKAIDYANKAYSAEPNSPLAAALLALAFTDANLPDLAKPLVESYPQTQIAAFAQAKLHLAAGNKQAALDSLRLAVDKDPGSIVAEQALAVLAGLSAEYIPIFDTGLMTANLQRDLGKQLVPQFVQPDQMLSFALNTRGTKFPYGKDFSGVVSITNNWFEPLIISDNALCRGHIIIDAEVTGDLNARFENLISATTRPTRTIEPGQNAVVTVRLCSGPLKTLFVNHPQASLNIKFTAWLDPVIVKDNNRANSIPGLKPAIVEIERSRVDITSEYLQNRFASLSKGKQGPKMKAAQLFAGLLIESRESPPYNLVRADWMPPMLKSGLIQSLNDNDWVVKVHTMAAVMNLPLDYELTGAVSAGLNDRHWPARMMAIWLLAPQQGYSFAKVLDHAAQYDESQLVRNMAIALGAKVPPPSQPIEQSLLELLGQEPNSPNQSPLGPLSSPAGVR
jgi:hypothetical protein